MKIFLEPNPGKRPDKADGGIRRVIEAQRKYLPEFGIKLINSIEKADITAGHVDHLPIAQGKPFVSHNHGLMWTDYFDDDSSRAINCSVVNAIIQSDAFTVPSAWVSRAFSYGLLKVPRVIYHGIDISEWTPQENRDNYVLWNKARADQVSDPSDVMRLAKRMSQTRFVSTIGNPAKNLEIINVAPYQQHKQWIARAGVYLATARETFGIGTLEALACGVPVAGWNYGGQSEIIKQGETGYLAPYGDYEALAECVSKCFAERKRLGVNARQDVIERWQWKDKIEQYANLYKEVYKNWNAPRPKVSVIIPCHNLAKFLPAALDSLKRQTLQDWQCIIVDDESIDDTAQVARQYTHDARIVYTRTPENLKLSRALNYGHSLAHGKYVMNLDADNMLPERTLEILSDALDTHRDLHIAYGGLDTVDVNGENRRPNGFPGAQFSWHGQIAHLNQLHSSAMMRREVMETSAGYRERQWRAEDAELWTRVSSLGFRIARVTNEPTLIYRWRPASKSAQERTLDPEGIDGEWNKYFPWRTAASGREGNKLFEKEQTACNNSHLVPFGAQGQRTDRNFWNVYHRQEPLISVIIPVGNGHKRYLVDALDSLTGQMTNQWEAVVINDTDETWDKVEGAPYARVIKNTTGKHGAGIAKNIGIDNAKGEFVFFLDADDMLEPSALVKMLKRFAQGMTSYVYCDAFVPESQLVNKIVPAVEYSQKMWLHNGLHTQAMLMLTQDAKRIRFDEDLQAWEDWDFIVRCAINGICGERVPEPLLLYRKHLGNRSEYGDSHRDEIKSFLHDRYNDYATGAKPMSPCGGCGSKTALNKVRESQAMTVRVESVDKPIPAGYVRMRYIGAKTAPVTFYANGHPYPAANTPKWRFVDVIEEDADKIKAMTVFVEVGRTPKEQPIPQPVQVQEQLIPKPQTTNYVPPPPKVTNEQMQKMMERLEGEREHNTRITNEPATQVQTPIETPTKPSPRKTHTRVTKAKR